MFDALLYPHAKSLGRIGDFVVWEMPALRPPSEAPYRVLCLSIPDYANGLYEIASLDNLDDGRRVPKSAEVSVGSAEDTLAVVKQADALMEGKDAPIDQETREELDRTFERVTKYPAYKVYLRKRR